MRGLFCNEGQTDAGLFDCGLTWDRVEIVVCRSNGEADFSAYTVKLLLAFKMDKMVKRGRLSIHLQKASKLSKEWGEGQMAHIRDFCKLEQQSSEDTWNVLVIVKREPL